MFHQSSNCWPELRSGARGCSVADAGFRAVPLICERCASRMAAGKEQVAYQCSGCGSVWELAGGRLAPRDVTNFSGSGEVRLPFWYASFTINCLEGCVNDIAGFMKMCGSVKTAAASTGPPSVFVPAFHLPPQQSIRLGRNMTVRFPSLLPLSAAQEQLIEPVTVSEADAQILAELVLLAALVEERRNNPSFLASFGVELSALRLVSIPFSREGNRLIQPEMNLEV
jgi:hypothetical protein